jgi:hypothetical protein
MNILDYKVDLRLINCSNAFLVTGTAKENRFNKSLFEKNQTGYWIVKTGRVQIGDAMFLLLPSVTTKTGYPRELFCGVVKGVSVTENNRKLFKVAEFFKLAPIESNVREFLLGQLPPQGDKVSTIWGPIERLGKTEAPVTSKAAKSRKPKSLLANYLGKQVTVEAALSIRDASRQRKGGELTFSCIECTGSVWPHRAGGNIGAHFEHVDHDPECSLCAKYRNTKNSHDNNRGDLEGASAIEGHAVDRRFLSLKRNRAIVRTCKKRDEFVCQACGYKLEIDGRFVIECHHLNPLSVVGKGKVHLKDLVSLCPTCHRVAHTKKTPIPIAELAKIVNTAKRIRNAGQNA